MEAFEAQNRVKKLVISLIGGQSRSFAKFAHITHQKSVWCDTGAHSFGIDAQHIVKGFFWIIGPFQRC